MQNARELTLQHGQIQSVRGKVLQSLMGSDAESLTVRRGSAEQSNTSILFGDRLILKLFRRQDVGANPDCEVGRYLTERANFDRVPPFAGSIEYESKEGQSLTLAMLQGLVLNEGDGWKWTIEELDRYYEHCATVPIPENLGDELASVVELSTQPPSAAAREHVGLYLESAATLGKRTAEMHLALASPTDDPAFSPEPFAPEELQFLIKELQDHAAAVFDVLKERVPSLPDELLEIAASVLSRRRRILQHFATFGSRDSGAPLPQRIRIHGDYHLGQVLRVKTDFVILDFEGEPARSLAYRRSKQSALKDVAGMLRSFGYAAYATLINYTARHPEDLATLEPWARFWERSVAAEFLRAYRQAAQGANFLPADESDFQNLLDAFLLDKALYEVLYELNSRPAWVRIPLMGIMSLSL
jgi:maltose alpha-D-glucosyltransferase/alpha-amylase